jgi:hypothetical protein
MFLQTKFASETYSAERRDREIYINNGLLSTLHKPKYFSWTIPARIVQRNLIWAANEKLRHESMSTYVFMLQGGSYPC